MIIFKYSLLNCIKQSTMLISALLILVMANLSACSNIEYVAQKKIYNAKGQYVGETANSFMGSELDVQVRDPEQLGNIYFGNPSSDEDISFEVRKETSRYMANSPIYKTENTRTDFTVNVGKDRDVWAGMSFKWQFNSPR